MTTHPPRWDLTAWFADFGAAFDRALDRCAAALAEIDAAAAALGPLDAARIERWSALLVDFEAVTTDLQHAGAYAGARSAADAEDAAAIAATARIAAITPIAEGIEARIVTTLGAADPAAFAALAARPALAGADYRLDRWRERAKRAMHPDAERLAADLAVHGLHSWGRLYRQVTSAMTFEADGETLPLAWLRGELEGGDPKRRAAVLAGASRAIASQSAVFAAALNGISGTRLTLDRRRGVRDPLDEALFESAIDRETLDAMMSVVADKAEIARRYLRHKARLLGRKNLAWSDLRAPIGGADVPLISWPEARVMVRDAFARHHPTLAAFSETMFDRGYIEAEPRRGKRPGAFCARSFTDGTSRVYMSYTGHDGDVRTLAHEIGHAYHNHVMRDLRPWARLYPMTLAETASIVAETLVSDAQLADPTAGDAGRLRVLDARLGQLVIYLLDIPTRFAFETACYAERARGEISAERACTLMTEAQARIFGDTLDPADRHPWYWAEKLHFFLPGRRFYNFPYTFGFLFGQGVLARAQAEGTETFHPTYIELLRRTGRGSVETIAAEVLGVDLRRPDFWAAALTGAEADLEAFEALGER